jgi:NADH dehydrogenase
MPRVVVIGGGYAGLACLIELAKKAPELELHLLDAAAEHCKVTNLHKTFSKPATDFKVPYAELAERFNFQFHQQRLDFKPADLQHWQAEKRLPLRDGHLDYDWLLLSTGASSSLSPQGEAVFGLEHLQAGRGPEMLENWLLQAQTEHLEISFVGGGSTGLQVLFELRELLRKQRADIGLRLIDLNPRTLPDLPEGAHRYITRKLRREGIDYLPETEFRAQQDGQVLLKESGSGREYRLPSTATLLFPGVQRSPFPIASNFYGQVEVAGELLPDIFSAGDCADFAGNGLNLLTAQAAVRKGKLVAHNIRNLHAGRGLRRYRYQEKGYLLSLGPVDAVGWLGLRCNLFTGFAANVLKEAMEGQYDLFLDGVDTYLGFP